MGPTALGLAVVPDVIRPAVFRTGIPAIIALMTLVTFAPALDNGFASWDDQALFVSNPGYRGLGWAHVSWMFSTVLMGHYVPVTWLTHGLDYVLWGLDPAGYHLVNLVFHAANAALFFLVAVRLLAAATAWSPARRRVAAAASALFFALHPLRVESVAWIAERRDVVSAFFFFLTLLLYLGAADRGSARRSSLLHAAALTTYALAIFSKCIVMTLPIVLTVLDVYPLRRLGPDWRAWGSAPARAVWREKIPYALLALVAATVGYYAQASGSTVTPLEQIGWTMRPSLAAYSLWFYVSKTVLPLDLSPLYELPLRLEPLAPRFVVAMVAVMTVTGILVGLRRRWPAGLAIWLSYALLIAPVSGLVHAGNQLAHDRYSYLSTLGLALLAGSAIASVVTLRPSPRLRPAFVSAGRVAAVAWIATLGYLSWDRVHVWKDAETLWFHAVDAQPDCSICQVNLGVALLGQGRSAPAIAQFEAALKQRPDRLRAHYNLGLALAQQGRLQEATEHLRWFVERQPRDVAGLSKLGVALARQGRYDEALPILQTATSYQPDDYESLATLGAVLGEAGRTTEAVTVLERSLRIRPEAPEPRLALTRAHLAMGNTEAAARQYRTLAALDGRLAQGVAPALITVW